MSFEQQIEGLSGTITPDDYKDALSQDDYVDAYVEKTTISRDFDHNCAALEHLLTSVDYMIHCSEKSSPYTFSVVAQPTTISAESIAADLVQSIKRFIETAIRTCGDMIQRLINWVKNLKSLLPNVLKSIASIRKKVEAVDGTPNPTHKNPAGLAKIAINNRVPRSASEVSKGLTDVVKVAAKVYAEYAPEVLSLEEKLSSALNQDLGDKGGVKHLLAVNQAMTSHHVLTRQLFNNNHIDGDFKVSESPVLLGSKKIVCSWASLDAIKKAAQEELPHSAFATAKLLQKSSVRLESTVSDNVALVPNASLFKTMNKNEMLGLLDAAAALVDIYNTFNEGSQTKLQDQIESSQKALSGMSMVKDAPAVVDGSIAMEDASYIRAIVAYHGSIAKWASEPFQQFASYLIDLINAILRLVKESVAQYA